MILLNTRDLMCLDKPLVDEIDSYFTTGRTPVIDVSPTLFPRLEQVLQNRCATAAIVQL